MIHRGQQPQHQSMYEEKRGPDAFYKTLRRLHGQNLDHQGLNDLTDAFQTFVTRARFFAVGRLRRTWSHSAVEFMKYRRRLPALLAPDCTSDEQNSALCISYMQMDDFNITPNLRKLSASPSKNSPSLPRSVSKDEPVLISDTPLELDPRKVQISNVAPGVTASQLTSFLTKFGTVGTCQMPMEPVKHGDQTFNPYSTMPRRRSRGIAYVTFKTHESALKALHAVAEELKFYSRVMVVAAMPAGRAHGKRHTLASASGGKSPIGLMSVSGLDDDTQSVTSSVEYNVEEPFDVNDVVSVFDAFDDQLLSGLFTYLTCVERIRIERVSKRWMEMAYKSWQCRDVLCVTSAELSVNGRVRPLQSSWLAALLRRCGHHIRSLDLSCTPHLLDENALNHVASLCPQLQALNVSGIRLKWQSIKHFGELCSDLQSIVYCNATHAGEKLIWHLFRSCRNLRYVDFSGCTRLTGRSFRMLGLLLEEVRLSGCHRLEREAVEEICLKSPNVQVLYLDECYLLDDTSLSLIGRYLSPSLCRLSLCGAHYSLVTKQGLMALCAATQLRHVQLDGHQLLDDRVLEAFVDAWPLVRSLSLAACTSLSSLAIQSLATFTALTQLDVSYIPSVSDVCLGIVIEQTNQLSHLRVRGCARLTGSCFPLFKHCTNIQDIDMSGCLQVCVASAESLLSAVQHSNAEHVRLVLGGTQCSATDLRTLQTHAAGTRVLIDTADHSMNTLPMSDPPRYANTDNDELYSDDDYTSDDEFESLCAQRSFIHELEEDELLPPDDQPNATVDWNAHLATTPSSNQSGGN